MEPTLVLIMLSLLSFAKVYAWKGVKLNARPGFRLLSQAMGGENQEKIALNIDISGNQMLSLGLSTQSVQALHVQGITKPTPVQKSVIPRLLNRESLVMAAATGSGKTLAYILPTIEHLHNEEMLGYIRRERRPRVLVLVPTRDLARQVLGCIKSVGHYSKVSSAAVFGGEQYAIQKKNLDRLVDIVVASPGRLLQHHQQHNVYLSNIHTVIIDEVDTMLMQGFGSDVRGVLRVVMQNKKAEEEGRDVQLVMATATLTKSVKALLTDVQGGFNIEYSDPTNATPKKLTGNETRVSMSVVEVDGLHRTLPQVTHNFIDTKGQDKILMLKDLLRTTGSAKAAAPQVLIFCNTVDSVRALEYALTEDSVLSRNGDSRDASTPKILSYHGDLNSIQRTENLAAFRNHSCNWLICTDIAARGLDIPTVHHVVMFDFPLNSVDYIHRAGRCGRAGVKGKVTSLITKRDAVLANGIEQAIKDGRPIDSVSSDKKDYQAGGSKVGLRAGLLSRARLGGGKGKGEGRGVGSSRLRSGMGGVSGTSRKDAKLSLNIREKLAERLRKGVRKSPEGGSVKKDSMASARGAWGYASSRSRSPSPAAGSRPNAGRGGVKRSFRGARGSAPREERAGARTGVPRGEGRSSVGASGRRSGEGPRTAKAGPRVVLKKPSARGGGRSRM